MADENLRKRSRELYIPKEDDHIILCRCEEITRGDIRKAIHHGLRTMNEIKRETRAGMGLCQGQTCTRIIRGFIASELGCSLAEVGYPTPRTPVRPIPMRLLAEDGMRKEAT